ncbi:hypothetical protein KCU99_g362, partial [Aureobasidium melanogenum]
MIHAPLLLFSATGRDVVVLRAYSRATIDSHGIEVCFTTAVGVKCSEVQWGALHIAWRTKEWITAPTHTKEAPGKTKSAANACA